MVDRKEKKKNYQATKAKKPNSLYILYVHIYAVPQRELGILRNVSIPV